MASRINSKALKQAIHKDSVVLFYAPWCGYCKQFHPTYDQLAGDMKGKGIHVLKIDMDKYGSDVRESKIGQERFGKPVSSGVQGYPTVLLFKKDGSTAKYSGPRTVSDMKKSISTFFEI